MNGKCGLCGKKAFAKVMLGENDSRVLCIHHFNHYMKFEDGGDIKFQKASDLYDTIKYKDV